MSDYFNHNNELYHYGVKGMKWGVRKAQPRYGARMVRGHGGPGIYIGKKRRYEGDKRDLDYMNKGGHLSIGLTKKRQAALDKRDRKIIEDRIAKYEGRLENRDPLRKAKDDLKDATRDYNKKFDKAYYMSGIHITKKGRMADQKRWEAVSDAYDKMRDAKVAYKSIKASEKAKKTAQKAEKALGKVKLNELEKRYGQLEDQYTYGKKADKAKNAKLDKEMSKLENEMKRYR